MDDLIFYTKQPTTQLKNLNLQSTINNDISKFTHYKIDQEDIFKQIKKSIDISSNTKSIVSLKYDTISFEINSIQISVIIVSLLIMFIETLNMIYDLSVFVESLLPILLASYIFFIVSLMRFFKMDNKKEVIGKTLDNFTYIINKSRKTNHRIKNFNITSKNIELWENLISNYENELCEFLLKIPEEPDEFENILHYNEFIYLNQWLINHYVNHICESKNININYLDKCDENVSISEKLYRYFCCKRNDVYFNYRNQFV